MSLKIALTMKVHEPTRGTEDSAGIDFYVPEISPEFTTAFNRENLDAQTQGFLDTGRNLICIHPGGRISIPLGVKTEFDKGLALVFFNKSGVSWKDRITNLAAIVDSDYQGTLFATFHNFSQYKTTLVPGQKLIQGLLIPYVSTSINVIPETEIHQKPTTRGDGAMGSTGK